MIADDDHSARTLSVLPADEVHLWYASPDELDERALASSYDLLSADERARHGRYRFEEDRHEFLVAHALVRTVLSRYAEPEPRAWVFETGPHGRPELVGPSGAPPLRFNLSHTRGLVACVVALDQDVGVDVEDTRRPGETVEIAHRFFAEEEVARLRALPPEGQRARFFDYWTLKEAYIKARGLGLAIPLDRFAFLLEPDQAVRIAFDPRLDDDPASWHFTRLRPTERHVAAIAVRARTAPKVVVRAQPAQRS